jgi:hypothetical protein
MPRPKANIEHHVGTGFSTEDVLNEYVEKHRLPKAWGGNETQRYVEALFVVRISMSPSGIDVRATFWDAPIHPIEDTKIQIRFARLFSSAPDNFIALAFYARQARYAIVELVAKELRECPNLSAPAGDKEIAVFLENKLGKKFHTSVIGKARRLLYERDRLAKQRAEDRIKAAAAEVLPFLMKKWPKQKQTKRKAKSLADSGLRKAEGSI